MGDMLTQEEINALLSGGMDSDAADSADSEPAVTSDANGYVPPSKEELDNALDSDQKDALGEIGNISMGTAATTLYSLLTHKVLITTPNDMVGVVFKL